MKSSKAESAMARFSLKSGPFLVEKGLKPDKQVGAKRKSELIGEITKYKHQITNKFQITISKSPIKSSAVCLEF
jgi:hypothetical protein